MIVDDALVVRGLYTHWLGEESDMEVVGAASDGQDAVDKVLRFDPDVVVLDIAMPGIDGLAALPLLLERKPELIIIISSALTRRNAETSLKALSLGAADYVCKPDSTRGIITAQDFRRDLIEKIRQLGRGGRRRSAQSQAAVQNLDAAWAFGPKPLPFKLRPFSLFPPRVLAIGGSTGGPQALEVLVRGLGPVLSRLPVLVVQHMPPVFTTIMAEQLGRITQRPAREAIDGEALAAGNIYIAPGGRHLKVERKGDLARLVLDDGPPVHFCKPAVDPLFASAAAAFGAGTLAVILTGMGSDGAEGASRIAAAGGSVIAQDEPTSVVWGMPGAAAHAKVCSAVLPVYEIAPKITALVTGDEP
jgi:two-component system chemotaxis response regulator CheB